MPIPGVYQKVAEGQQSQRKTGTVEAPKKFKAQDFNSLRETCLNRRQLFEDDVFPASLYSIGQDLLSQDKLLSIKWKRPSVSNKPFRIGEIYPARGWVERGKPTICRQKKSNLIINAWKGSFGTQTEDENLCTPPIFNPAEKELDNLYVQWPDHCMVLTNTGQGPFIAIFWFKDNGGRIW